MLGSLGSALRRKPRRLVEDEAVGVAMEHHLADQFLFLGRERLARLLRPRSARGFGLARWDLDRLPRLKPVARRCALSVHAKLAGPRPPRHDVERRRRQVALKPAVETD